MESFVLPFDDMKLVSRQGWRAERRDNRRIVSMSWANEHPELVRYRWHNGTDWVRHHGRTQGTELRAGMESIVRFADARGGVTPFTGYGNAVVLQYSDQVLSLFAHCDEILVVPGDRVQAGQPVATIGRTSRPGREISSAHLHWELVKRWPLRADATRERYDVLASLATQGYRLDGNAVLTAGAREEVIPSGTVRAHPQPYRPSESGGFVDLVVLAAIVRAATRDRR